MPPLAWVSDIVSVLQNGFTPVFVDIDPRTLSMDSAQVLAKINDRTRAVFITHAQGFDGLTDELLAELIGNLFPDEDVCESHGATHNGIRLGAIGWISNFSFYYAHHMSTMRVAWCVRTTMMSISASDTAVPWNGPKRQTQD